MKYKLILCCWCNGNDVDTVMIVFLFLQSPIGLPQSPNVRAPMLSSKRSQFKSADLSLLQTPDTTITNSAVISTNTDAHPDPQSREAVAPNLTSLFSMILKRALVTLRWPSGGHCRGGGPLGLSGMVW
jgi:hypothetical protein